MIIELRRHNGQNAYGDWISQEEGILSDAAYEEVQCIYDAAYQNQASDDSGHVEVGGQEYDWRIQEEN